MIGYILGMKQQWKVGQSIVVPEWEKMPHMVCHGTVTQVTKNKVRVLFPFRKFVWLDKSQVKRVRP